MIEAGCKKIPETYLRTLGEEDAAEAHKLISPADKVSRSIRSNNNAHARVRHKYPAQSDYTSPAAP